MDEQTVMSPFGICHTRSTFVPLSRLKINLDPVPVTLAIVDVTFVPVFEAGRIRGTTQGGLGNLKRDPGQYLNTQV